MGEVEGCPWLLAWAAFGHSLPRHSARPLQHHSPHYLGHHSECSSGHHLERFSGHHSEHFSGQHSARFRLVSAAGFLDGPENKHVYC